MRIAIAAALLCAALTAPPASGAPDACAGFGGFIEASGQCRVQASAADYTMDLSFPLDYPDIEAVVSYLTETRDGFVSVAQTPDTREVTHQLDVTAESFRSARTHSVVLTLFQDLGGAHPTAWYKSFTYDLGRNRPVTFDTLFAAGAKPLDTVFPIVQQTLEAQTGLPGSISSDAGHDPAHYQNFAVSDEAVIFFFGRAELLPSYAGETSVAVPRNAIPPLQV
ncbi:MAG: DUF3298 domain-containing protein [Mycobacterium sp.]|nr:DUF3298 domain-containing protein [Mycobacterium sp.]